jgi:hypothetical protein
VRTTVAACPLRALAKWRNALRGTILFRNGRQDNAGVNADLIAVHDWFTKKKISSEMNRTGCCEDAKY